MMPQYTIGRVLIVIVNGIFKLRYEFIWCVQVSYTPQSEYEGVT